MSDLGRPLSILCDTAPEFTGREMRTWTDHQGIELLYTTSYHPQTNGLIDRTHRTLKTLPAQMGKGYPLRWPALLGECQFYVMEDSYSGKLVQRAGKKMKPHDCEPEWNYSGVGGGNDRWTCGGCRGSGPPRLHAVSLSDGSLKSSKVMCKLRSNVKWPLLDCSLQDIRKMVPEREMS